MMRRIVKCWLQAVQQPLVGPTPGAAGARQLAHDSVGGVTRGGAGLFGIERLQRPEDFLIWSKEAVER